MTTAHRPTFDPARGKDALRGPAYHQRLQAAHTKLKFRKAGQGGDGDREVRDLRAELLQAEAAHKAKLHGGPIPDDDSEAPESSTNASKRPLEIANHEADEEDAEAKRRRILEETRDIDADDSEEDDDDDDDSEDDSDDDEDETAELQRELEKIKRERAEKREREERERAAAEQEEKERDIALGNPLLNKPDFNIKRRWDDDVVFKNQARGTDDKGKKKEFINSLLDRRYGGHQDLKLEELQREVLSIKEAVGKSVATNLMNPSPPTSTSSPHFVNGRVPQPRALKSRVFSGEDIGLYFQRYFECFHDYFPIVRLQDPDKCYEKAPVLFWAILMVSARRFAKDSTVLPFLTESVPPEIWSAAAVPPLSVEAINALLLLCAWPLTTIRFIADPSAHYMSLAMTSCYLLGLQSGRGEQPELLRPNYQIRCTDEEAAYTWAGANIITQKVSTYIGIPTTSTSFNQTIEELLDGKASTQFPTHYSVVLECARFSNRVSKTMCAALEGVESISPHLIYMYEEEFAKLQGLMQPELSELDQFVLQSTLLELQSYYFTAPQDLTAEPKMRNIFKAFNTSQSLIQQALKLHSDKLFLAYAPHYVCRTLLLAACIIILGALSPDMRDTPLPSRNGLVQDAISTIKHCSVIGGDISWRGAKMLETYWSFCQMQAPIKVDMTRISQFSHRLGTSLVFECLRQWKRRVESTLPPTSSSTKDQPTNEGTEEGLTKPYPAGVPTDENTAEQDIQFFDWDALMTEFDWSFMPDITPSLNV
ncbi:uncharacterized protein E0L32_008242 [Thyridium curvatum]|uniref:Uncharacterized protein n=1 Tax=Thyridium curvatum TaxID=1093900 RepID=A0A507ASY5_9PEZI|nr:uncharacterized protein E0L32_008242 [Thyridium curvatum]TPX10853.1 hypothetical protein E0L32_008242 [Thyridium curvatum]